MGNLIIAAVVAALIGAAVIYIWKEKKKGSGCIGCPYAKQCAGKGHTNTQGGCGCNNTKA